MTCYIGYGFDVNDLTNEDWVKILSEKDADIFKEFKADCQMKRGSDDHDVLIEEVTDWLEGNNYSLADYLHSLINGKEKAAVGIGNVVVCIEPYFFFDSICFAGDEPRAEYIRSSDDFIKMIGKYVPTENLTFGNLYEGSDWMDPVFTLE